MSKIVTPYQPTHPIIHGEDMPEVTNLALGTGLIAG
jgi:hypothetical protein